MEVCKQETRWKVAELLQKWCQNIQSHFFHTMFAWQLLEARRGNLLWWERRRCAKGFIFAIAGSGEGGGSYSDWARVQGHWPGERPALIHQWQPQAAVVGTSSFYFVVFGCSMEPWLIAFVCVLIRPMLTIPCSVSCRATFLVCAELRVHHTLSST